MGRPCTRPRCQFAPTARGVRRHRRRRRAEMATFSVAERLLLFAGLGMLCFAMMGSHFVSNRSRQRRAYWLSWLLGGSLVVVSVAHRGLDWALMPAGMIAF